MSQTYISARRNSQVSVKFHIDVVEIIKFIASAEAFKRANIKYLDHQKRMHCNYE